MNQPTDLQAMQQRLAELELENQSLRGRLGEARQLPGLEERLKLAMEAMQDGLWDWDIESDAAYFSPSFSRMLGYEPGVLSGRGQTWKDLLHPDDRQQTWQMNLDCIEGRRSSFDVEFRMRKRDDTWCWVLGRGRCVARDDQGRAVRMVGTLIDITGLKRSEGTLRDSEEQYRLLFAGNPNPMWVFDEQTLRFLAVNDAAVREYGWSRDEFLSMTLLDVRPTEDRASVPQIVQQSRGTGETRVGVLRHCRRDGTIVQMEATASTILFGGRPGRLCSMIDVTGRHQAIEALRQSEERLRFALETARIGAWDLDLVDHTAYRSPDHDRIFGYPELLPKWTYEMALEHVVPEDREMFDKTFRQATQSGSNWTFECRIRRADGEIRWIWAAGRHILDASGSPRRIAGVVQDITERKSAEEALRASERLYRAIGESIDYGIWVCDAQGRNNYTSDSLLKLVGITREQCADFGWGDVLHPDDAQETLDAWRQCVRSGGPWYREHRYRGADGEYHPILACGVPVRNERGDITAWAGINLDISRLKQAEASLAASKLRAEQARAEAEAANKAKDHFLAVLSHELRTPLNPVLLAASNLEGDATLDPEQRDAIAIIRRNVELQARLIDDLLDITRVARGKIHLNRTVVDLREILRHAAQTVDAEARSKAQRMIVEIDDVPLWVNGDAARLEQVFWNLIRNAIKFTPDRGEIRLKAWAGTAGRGVSGDGDQPAPCAVIEISDTGIGIDEVTLPRIFDAFEQAAAARLFGGLGLGLTIVKSLVELHDGTVTAHSQGKDKGAAFCVALPLTSHLLPQSKQRPATLSGSGAALRILVVEDHPDSARILARLLTKMGHTVAVAESVASGLRSAKAQAFDLLISDIGLPDGSGLDLMRQIKAHSPLPGIVISGHGMEQDIQHSLEAGFVMHLTKPVGLTQLKAAVSAVMNTPLDDE